MRKVAILTGKRGGFGAMLGIMQLLDRDPEMTFELIVTDMHLSKQFGETVHEVEKWFSVAHKLDLAQQGDSGPERAHALTRCMGQMVNVLTSSRPDILLLLGDRGEVLSAAIAAFELNIPVAHILGGDVAGNRDGNRIHAITKLAHLHFPSSQNAHDRILNLGEEPWRVHNFGATYVDFIVQKKYTPHAAVREKYRLGDQPYLLLLQHPMTLQEEGSYQEAKAVLEAAKQTGLQTIVIYPCSDQGYAGTLNAIDEYANTPTFQIHKNIEALDFWGLQERAECLLGNSSSGLMEAPYFNLPTVNVGQRQRGRLRDENVVDVEPDTQKILLAIERARSSDFRKRLINHHLFGDGHASERIVDVLKTVPLDNRLLEKRIAY